MQLRIKHAGKTHEVSVSPDASGADLKTLIAGLTNVPNERQKVIAKGKQISDTIKLSDAKLADGQMLMMLGSAAPVVVPEPVQTDEQPDDEEMDDQIEKIPVGLLNIGNTCYANAVLQALRTVPELNTALEKYTGSSALLKAWAQLIPRFGYPAPIETEAPTPYAFLSALRQKVPQFAELGEMGVPKQQDAEELWTALFSELSENGGAGIADAVADFTGTLQTSVERAESAESAEPADAATSTDVTTPETSYEPFTKLLCHITIRTNFVRDGLLASLTEKRETAENSGAFDDVSKRITEFPKYLTVQFVRFFWRKDSNASSKILRQVAFPLQLDAGVLATPELCKRVQPAKDAFRALENALEEAKRQQRRAKFRKLDAIQPDSSVDLAEKAEAEREASHIAELRKQLDDAVLEGKTNPAHSSTGVYNLQAVVTHLGTSANSGHYQCFTRNPEKPNSWWRFNDDSVSEVDDNRIMQLAGGGASDSALILLYKSAESM